MLAFIFERNVQIMNKLLATRRVAENIRAVMGRQDVTIAALADDIGLTRSTLSRRLSPTGRAALTIDEIAEIARVLGVSVDELLGRPAPAAQAS